MTEHGHKPAWRLRIAAVAGGFALIGVLLVARAVDLQILDTGFLEGQAEARHVRTVPIPAHRGMIKDRRGDPLAVSTPVDSVWVDPGKLLGKAGRPGIERLARAVGREPERLAEHLRAHRERAFVYVKRHMIPSRAEAVAERDLPGVHLRREYRRFYPTGEVTGHLLGFTNIDDRGQEGLEKAFDDRLRGEPGRKRVLRDRYGRRIENLGRVEPAEPGQELTLSIDRRLQYLAYRELKAAVRKHDAASGSIVLLDVRTGELLAMVNQPGFNPNTRPEPETGRFRNRAVTDVLEPGSAFKPFVVGAALEQGVVEPGFAIDTSPGFHRVQGHRISDRKNFGRIDLTEILSLSSNVGASKVALRLEPAGLYGVLRRFGFARATSGPFPAESDGTLPPPGSWRAIRQATLAYGYGVSLTPLQLAQAYAALAADGVRRPVSVTPVGDPPRGERALSRDTARTIQRMLVESVANGTGSRAAIPGYRVAGKTGTARQGGADGYGDDYIAVFGGFIPASDPRLAAAVVVREPSGDTYYGGRVAAPPFARLMSGAARLLGIPPDGLGDEPGGVVRVPEAPGDGEMG